MVDQSDPASAIAELVGIAVVKHAFALGDGFRPELPQFAGVVIVIFHTLAVEKHDQVVVVPFTRLVFKLADVANRMLENTFELLAALQLQKLFEVAANILKGKVVAYGFLEAQIHTNDEQLGVNRECLIDELFAACIVLFSPHAAEAQAFLV
ncbi:hypothetical protein D3C71_1337960 [compost metagenome]